MFNPEENGPADAGVKGWRRDDLFDANKFFSSTFSTTTVQADQWPIHTNLTPRWEPITNSPSGPIGSNLLLSFDLLPKFECTHKPSIFFSLHRAKLLDQLRVYVMEGKKGAKLLHQMQKTSYGCDRRYWIHTYRLLQVWTLFLFKLRL